MFARLRFLFLFVAGFACFSAPVSSQTPTFSKVDLVAKLSKEYIFRIDGPEIPTNGPLLRRVELGTDSAITTYLNASTARARSSKFSFRVFNAYGMEIASFTASTKPLLPGETYQQNHKFVVHPLDKFLEFAAVLPSDWQAAAFLLVRPL